MLRSWSLMFFGALIVLSLGCARNVVAPRDAAVPSGLTVYPNETIHGVLVVAGPGQAGVQGATAPFLAGDNGTAYALQLSADQDALRDPMASGRGVTLTGDMLVFDPVPVGENERLIIVTSHQFDSE